MRLVVLALGMFAIGTDTFVIAGILGDVGADLDVSTAAAGQLVTAFALAYAVLSPLLAAATASWPRRRLLLTALAVFTLGNAATALAPTYPVALVARVLTAAGAALYAPNAAAAAASLVAPERRARALAVVSGGMGTAMAAGAPLGTWLAGHADWRATLWLVTALGTVALAGLAASLRGVPTPPAVPLRERLRPLGTFSVQRVLVVTFWIYIGVYAIYPYLGDLIADATHGSPGRLAWALTAFGVGSLIGAPFAGHIIDRYGSRRVIVVGVTGIATAIMLLTVADATFATTAAALILWGATGWSATLAQQHRIIALAPQSAPIYVSLNSSVQYTGIAVGSAIGGPLLAAVGKNGLLIYTGAFLLAAAAFAATTSRTSARTVASSHQAVAADRIPLAVD
ncbi:MFS transporter [Yinghuangia seranimata]|uniref:MFS transporter n=1 Tax=Yinghuangia seranimata TaxID=408067 RepID=UPI00248D3447|nr:MFS transporter [Yinghuangia seranimata]MDI2126504.1 MFS transporter [Yinghuangia seranimata]